MCKPLTFVFRLALFLSGTAAFAQRNYTRLVNPFIGTGGHGHNYPGASMPAGMMQLSPDTRLEGWDGCGGYHYNDSAIYGFSHTHLSGTGIPDYCDVLLMPFTGNVSWNNEAYRSSFSHSKEKASPGYYEVLLDKHNIRAQLTTSYRSGMHRYQFPAKNRNGSVLIDLKHRDEVLESYIEKVSDTEIRGYRRSKAWAADQHLYFYLRFDRPMTNFIIHSNGATITGTSQQGKNLQAAANFDLGDAATVQVKVGISGVSMDGAKQNLDTEIPGWDFEKVHTDAIAAWNTELGRIEVQGGTPDQQTIFYTALYHTFLNPNIYTDVDGQYRGTDLKVHKAEGFTNHTVFSLWDTFRGFNPLMTIINQKKVTDWINTFLVQYKYGGMLPVWELSGNETFCMVGYHCVPVIVDAWQKGIRGFDAQLALEGMIAYAESNRFGLPQYRQEGYISNDIEHESVSKTVDYAYDDWCIAQFAKMTGNQEVYNRYIQRAQNYKNLFDPGSGHIRGKVRSAWYTPFDAREINNFYTEGNSWQYSFAAPQDISGLVHLYGGREKFAAKLEELFTTNSGLTGREQQDVTGLIGQYAHGNEPSHHIAYLFNYAGRPWRTQEIIHQICTSFYTNAPDGLIGNEDCGQMSAWYVLSAMGFYPVCPGHGDYAIGTPLFNEVTIHLENGKQFRISAHRQSVADFYIREATLNGRPHSSTALLHTDIMKGGRIEFNMSGQPQRAWGIAEKNLPFTAITDQLIVPAPYFGIESNKFRGSMNIPLKDVERSSQLYYYIAPGAAAVPPALTSFSRYTAPFVVKKNATVYAYATRTGKASKLVSQTFYRLPDDRALTVLSVVNPMYTGGGNDILIDGVLGTENWRNGEWQGYYDKDFEAVIDLKKTKPVTYAAVHVVQDASPWILFPKELIVLASSDGKEYREVGRISNNFPADSKEVRVQELGVSFHTEARYIKVKAVNGGKLPAWHESAGNPSHLFLDEVIVK